LVFFFSYPPSVPVMIGTLLSRWCRDEFMVFRKLLFFSFHFPGVREQSHQFPSPPLEFFCLRAAQALFSLPQLFLFFSPSPIRFPNTYARVVQACACFLDASVDSLPLRGVWMMPSVRFFGSTSSGTSVPPFPSFISVRPVQKFSLFVPVLPRVSSRCGSERTSFFTGKIFFDCGAAPCSSFPPPARQIPPLLTLILSPCRMC